MGITLGQYENTLERDIRRMHRDLGHGRVKMIYSSNLSISAEDVVYCNCPEETDAVQELKCGRYQLYAWISV